MNGDGEQDSLWMEPNAERSYRCGNGLIVKEGAWGEVISVINSKHTCQSQVYDAASMQSGYHSLKKGTTNFHLSAEIIT